MLSSTMLLALGGALSYVPHVARLHRSLVAPASRRLAVAPRAALTTDESIIPKDVLFGNPEYSSPMLSPDGALLAYLRPDENGVLNLWCRTLGKVDDRVVTADRYRGIRQAFWAEDSKTLLYMQDDAGDENFHLFAIDAMAPSATARDLTPFKGAKAQNVITNKRFPEELLVAINSRDPSKFDMYRCTIASGALTLDTENPGDVLGFGTYDETFEVREAIAMNPADSSTIVRVRDSVDDAWRELIAFPYGEEGNMVDFSKDAKTCLVLSSLGRETTALLRLDAATGALVEEIAASDKCNCAGILLDDDTKAVRAVSFNYARTERQFFDAALEAHFKHLEAKGPAQAEVGL